MSLFSKGLLKILRNFICIFIPSLLMSTTSPNQPIISPSLLELLQVMNVKHDGTLSSIVEATQKQWLRPEGKERWEIAELPPEKAALVIELADRMGLFQEARPSSTHYEYCLLLGATGYAMQKRLNYMIQLWNEGVHFDEVVFLVSHRPLDAAVEPINNCKTEADSARLIWKTTTMPEELKALPVTFVDTSMTQDKSGTKTASTIDTIEAWLAIKPHPGSCLFISNQPYCLYQNAVVKRSLPQTFTFQTVGPSATPERQKAAVLLDTIARWLYNENLAMALKSKS